MRAQRGLTRLEAAIAAALVAVFAAFLLHAVRREQEDAERLVVELTVMSIRTGLLSEAAERLIKGRGRETADLLGSNPVRWLKGPPVGYLGEFKEVDERRLAPGSWYFDQSTGELVYKIHLAGNFRRLDGSGHNEIRWRVQFRQEADSALATVGEVALLPSVKYEWF